MSDDLGVSDALILCTRHRPDEVAGCLDSIREQVALPPHVLVVDSSDDARTQQVVDAARSGWPAGSRLEHRRSAPALTHQRVVGLAATRGDLVHFVDDDVRLDRHYVANVRAAFADGRVAGVGGVDTARDVVAVKRVDEWFGLDSRRDGAVLRSGRNIPVRREPAGLLEVDWLAGAAMSYRRDALEAEPPDESFPFEGEDVQLSFRVGRQGRLVVVPGARYEHREAQSNRVAGARQVENELVTRYRRVVGDPRLSTRAYWTSAVAQLVKYTASGVASRSARRVDIARGTWHAIRAIRQGRFG